MRKLRFIDRGARAERRFLPVREPHGFTVCQCVSGCPPLRLMAIGPTAEPVTGFVRRMS